MKKLTSLGLSMLIAPALALSAGVALAAEHGAKPKATQSQQQHSAQRMPIVSRPANAILSDDLIGSPLMSRQGENFGPINNILVDKDGQVLAVIVSVGGFLGIGQRDVAIAWNALERSVDGDGDAVFHVDMTNAQLRDAPAYKND